MKKLATITGLLALMLVVTSFTTPNKVNEIRPGGGRPIGEFTSTINEVRPGGGRPIGE